MTTDFSDDALLLIAHGSTVNSQSSEPTRRLTEELNSRKLFAEVSCAFKLEEPYISDALKELSSKRVFAAPITISEGQFTEEIIPFHLGLCTKGQCDCPVGECNYPSNAEVNGKQIVYCRPVGTHNTMTDVLLGRAKEIVQKYPFPKPPKPEEICLIIAGHGTKRNIKSRKAIEAQVQAIKELGEYADVQSAFMEETPLIADCYENAGARHIVMVPFFIADGLHTVEDIPVLLGETEKQVKQRLEANQVTWRNPTERKGKLVWYTEAIGSEPHLPEVILERVREAAA